MSTTPSRWRLLLRVASVLCLRLAAAASPTLLGAWGTWRRAAPERR